MESQVGTANLNNVVAQTARRSSQRQDAAGIENCKSAVKELPTATKLTPAGGTIGDRELLDYNRIRETAAQEIRRDPLPNLVQVPKDDVRVAETARKDLWSAASEDLRSIPEFMKPNVSWLETKSFTTVVLKEYESNFGFQGTATHRKKAGLLPYPEFEVDSHSVNSTANVNDAKNEKPGARLANCHDFTKWNAKTSDDNATELRNGDRLSLAAVVEDAPSSTSFAAAQTFSVSSCPKGTVPFDFSAMVSDTRAFKVSTPMLNFDFFNEEPFWTSMALYDISCNQRISENVYSSLRMSDTPSGRAHHVFQVTYPSPDIYLLVRVERILQGDIAPLYEKYSNLKGRKPSMGELRDIHQRLGSYRQPWVWAALPIFSITNSELTLAETRQGAIFKVDEDKCSDTEMCQLLSALSKGAILKKAKVIPGTLTARFEELLPGSGDDAALIAGAAREFAPRPLYEPVLKYENDVFIYPLALNLAKINSGRNIYCKVELVTGDGTSAELYKRPGWGVTEGYGDTAVTYHSRNTEYYEELKFALPTDFKSMENWHILFTIYHITCKEKREKDTETELGKAFLPLYQNSRWTASGEYQLPIASSLAQDYIRNQDSSLHKWYENRKPLLIFRLATHSSLIPTSAPIMDFFNSSETEPLKQTISDLEAISDSDLTSFSVPIFDRLFKVLLYNSGPGNVAVFNVLVNFVHRLSQSIPEKGTAILQHYVHFHYKPNLSKGALDWVALWRDAHRDVSLSGKFATTAWFFFGVLTKSCLLLRIQAPKSVEQVVRAVSEEIVKRGASSVMTSKRLNATLAGFLVQTTRFVDVDMVFAWIHQHTMQLDAAAGVAQGANARVGVPLNDSVDWPMATLKYQFLTIIASHEHFVPLNLPLASYQSLSSNKSSGTLSEYWRRHFLIGIILNDVRKSLKHDNPYLRLTSLSLLQSLLVKHSLDERYSTHVARARIMSMYWPFILLACDHELRLASAALPTTNVSAGTPATSANAMELETIGACFFLILKYLPKDNVLKWLSRSETARRESFYHLLCVFSNVFQYQGKQELCGKHRSVQQGASTFSLTQDTKHAFEEWYSNTGKPKYKRGLNSRATSAVSGILSSGATAAGGTTTPMLALSETRTAIGTAKSSASDSPTRFSVNGSVALASSTEKDSQTNAISGWKSSNPGDVELACKLKALLSVEVSLTILQVLEDILQDYHAYEYSDARVVNQPRSLVELDRFFAVYVSLLKVPQSRSVLVHIARSMKNFVFRFSKYLMQTKNKAILALLQSLLVYQATNSFETEYFTSVLYVTLQRNYAEKNGNITKVQAQSAVALSQIELQHEGPLLETLNLLLSIVQSDPQSGSNRFVQLVKDFVGLLSALARDSAQVFQYRYDPEAVAELHVRMAKSYASNSPDLRLATLETLAEMHRTAENGQVEAAVCVLQSCKLVNSFLVATKQIDWQQWAIEFSWSQVIANKLDDELEAYENDERQWSLWKEQGMCESSAFSKEWLLQSLEKAFQLFRQANHWETASQVAQILLFQYSQQKLFRESAGIYQQLQQDSTELAATHNSSKRISGSYFRVGFFHFPLSTFDGNEYVYKERAYVSLAEMCQKLTSCYAQKFGDKVCLIQDSGKVDRTKLDPSKVYLQVTAVVPHASSTAANLSTWERSTNVDEFAYETPYTSGNSAKAHGGVHEQCKRRTIIKTVKKFPDLQRRLMVVSSCNIELDPLQVAIEALSERTAKLDALACTSAQFPNEKPLAFKDPKALQLLLQGSVRIQVNAGSLEYAKIFLAPALQVQGKLEPGTLIGNYSFERVSQLASVFEQFLEMCSISVELNRSLIKEDQVQYQEDLEVGLQELRESLAPYLQPFASEALNAAGTTKGRKPRSESNGSHSSAFGRHRSQSLIAQQTHASAVSPQPRGRDNSVSGSTGNGPVSGSGTPLVSSVSAFTNRVLSMTVNSIQRLPSISLLGAPSNESTAVEKPAKTDSNSAQQLDVEKTVAQEPVSRGRKPNTVSTALASGSSATSNAAFEASLSSKPLKLAPSAQKSMSQGSGTNSPATRPDYQTPTSMKSSGEPALSVDIAPEKDGRNGGRGSPSGSPSLGFRMSTPPAINSSKASDSSRNVSPNLKSRPVSAMSTISNQSSRDNGNSELLQKFAQRNLQKTANKE